MKSRSIYKTILSGWVLVCVMMLTACTDSFEKWNIDPNAATEEDMNHDNLNTGAYLAQMQRGVFIVGENLGGRYQETQALEGDLFASFLATITTWGYTTYHNDHYALYSDWYDKPFNDAYTNVMQPWKSICEKTEEGSPARALATVIKVFAMHRVSDMYGPIPYKSFGTAVQVPYDSQKDVYYQFFTELDNAISILTSYANTNSSAYMGDYDNIYSGNISKWIKFANTLRLRLAMRISNVDEAKARQEAEAAINQSYGLMASADDDATLHQNATLSFRHPLWEIGQSFHDERMSATMECYLKGYNDPRIKAYFLPSEANGDYKGARNGMNRPNKDNYKDITSAPNFSQGSDMQWMHAAEAYFLLAEAKLRWGLGELSAQECYETGIATSFASAGANGASSYISNNTSLPQETFMDAYSRSTTSVASMLSNLTVAWDESASNEVKMERIMIQKWIALYPDGQEAWSEMRRTGYPGWVRIQSMQTTEVTQNEMISRLKFPTTEYSNNSDNTKAGVTLLGGDDKAGTRLWWDVKR
ncbi:MAG: SusD/RagB family nutrient-binding outer membrane lipoprotein [Prevotella sp.]|nr:SusD/RagB family nutrient-binding outer membrane lipoprotein [Prevotella sp.]